MPQSGAHGASPAGRGRGVRASPEPVEGPRGICGEDAAATGSGTLRNEGISPKGAHAMAACRACPAKLWRSRGGCAPLASRACLRTLPRIVIWNVLSRLQNRASGLRWAAIKARKSSFAPPNKPSDFACRRWLRSDRSHPRSSSDLPNLPPRYA